MLRGQGRASAALAPLIRDVVAPQLPGLAERLGANARILDVGVGVGALAIALARIFPASRIVGIDVWPPSLAVARADVAEASLTERIELRMQDVATLGEESAYDLIWFSGPFAPTAIQPRALRACARALSRGGWIVYGAFGGGDERANRLAELRTLRSGGPVLSSDEIARALGAAGLDDARAIHLDIGIPVRMVGARRGAEER
ncbi:MAG: class I SAM-dependent methyltransferase [Labilithrix sp.]